MARITAEEREQKKKMMDEYIYNLFVTEGWDAITYDRLAKDLNIGKSSVQRYYENKMLFATALQGRIFPEVIRQLDFTSKDRFIESWISAYHNQSSLIFREAVRMLMTNIMTASTSPYSRNAVNRLESMLSANIGEEEANLSIKIALGTIAYSYMHQ